MNKTLLFIAVLLLGPSAFAKDCYAGNNVCPSGQGCCSSRAEWIHTWTTDSGTCRELRHCDENWIWNGSLNPNSDYKLPGPVPALPSDEGMTKAAEIDFNRVAAWYDMSGAGGLKRNTNPWKFLIVHPADKKPITYSQRVVARSAWIGCLIGTQGFDNVASYLNAKHAGYPSCAGNDNCAQYHEERMAYFKNTALVCLVKNFYEPYSVGDSYPSVEYGSTAPDYTKCPVNYSNCDPVPFIPPR